MRYVLTLSLAFVVSAFTSASWAGVPDAGAKMRGDVNGESSAARRSGSVYRRSITADSASPAVEGQTQRRSYSYEPNGEGSARARSNRSNSAQVRKPARSNSRSVRRFSYEPRRNSYDRPMTRGRSRSPSYLLPKTDARRYQ